MEDLIFAVPGTRRPRSEVEALRRRLEWLMAQTPFDAVPRGALDAARWTLLEVPDPPLSSRRGVDVVGVEAERDLARAVMLGVCPGDVERAAGVRAWLEWWLEISAAPSWMAPTRRPGH